MKKLALALSSAAAYLSLTSYAFAADTVQACPAGQFANLCNFKFGNVIPALVSTIFIIAIIVALLYLLWGGFKWITSGGDKGGVQAAREHIVAALVGLVIIFLAYFILNIVVGFFLQGTTVNNFSLPVVQ